MTKKVIDSFGKKPLPLTSSLTSEKFGGTLYNLVEGKYVRRGLVIRIVWAFHLSFSGLKS